MCVCFMSLRDCACVLVFVNACACVCFVDLKKERKNRARLDLVEKTSFPVDERQSQSLQYK